MMAHTICARVASAFLPIFGLITNSAEVLRGMGGSALARKRVERMDGLVAYCLSEAFADHHASAWAFCPSFGA